LSREKLDKNGKSLKMGIDILSGKEWDGGIFI
jgi:hypothetical protein